MLWNNHSKLRGLHAFMGASKYHWINYDEDKIALAYKNSIAAQKGTALHEYAAMAITLGRKQPNNNDTVNMYVNDALGYHMKPEQILYYSENCFGTADSISFRRGQLRIHDLKTGTSPVHMEQLYIYAALFCLEYDHKPSEIETILRLYYMNEVTEDRPDSDVVFSIMDKIVRFDKIITRIRKEEIDV